MSVNNISPYEWFCETRKNKAIFTFSLELCGDTNCPNADDSILAFCGTYYPSAQTHSTRGNDTQLHATPIITTGSASPRCTVGGVTVIHTGSS
jgi:hypothetical protein